MNGRKGALECLFPFMQKAKRQSTIFSLHHCPRRENFNNFIALICSIVRISILLLYEMESCNYGYPIQLFIGSNIPTGFLIGFSLLVVADHETQKPFNSDNEQYTLISI